MLRSPLCYPFRNYIREFTEFLRGSDKTKIDGSFRCLFFLNIRFVFCISGRSGKGIDSWKLISGRFHCKFSRGKFPTIFFIFETQKSELMPISTVYFISFCLSTTCYFINIRHFFSYFYPFLFRFFCPLDFHCTFLFSSFVFLRRRAKPFFLFFNFVIRSSCCFCFCDDRSLNLLSSDLYFPFVLIFSFFFWPIT